MNEGRGLKLTRSTEALRDILLISALKEPSNRRVQRAKKRIEQFCDDAMAFYDSFYGDDRDNVQRVRDDKGKLRDRVDQGGGERYEEIDQGHPLLHGDRAGKGAVDSHRPEAIEPPRDSANRCELE
jgi:hypothetical protein